MNDGAIVVETSTTKAVRPPERADYWSELINSFHCPMTAEFDHRRDFHGEVACRRTDSYQLVEWTADEARYRRTIAQIRRNTDEDYRLVLPVAGQIALRQYDLGSRLPPGTAGLMTMSEPFEFTQYGGTHAYVMTIPRREVDHRLHRSAPVAGRFDLSTGLGRVVAGLALGLFQESETLTLRQFDAVADRLVELLCMLIIGDVRLTAPTHLTELEAAVRFYVREHAADAHLNGRTVAHALGWSLRQVQLALQHAGTTPRELIREERLQLARERLRNPAYHHWTVTEVARRSGFSSLSAFSNSFRQRFGVRPRQARD
ncbi:AraC-type DNA-binding protein [Amycolatopsis marina]|uniref:AraC-type DNA-binding protein n=1 Tax=Amycolatopsis marina TaxID=490629 RepID=A0A1I0XXM0_9PSEU|nr:AraC family transcriptional regulator [Amycolatopsis marina]SFB05176.1 AraC-type DNA-binding protein [Amycolatopsis marina]